MEEIVAVDRDHSGNIISFKTNTGRIISYRKAIQEIEQGKISGVMLKEQTLAIFQLSRILVQMIHISRISLLSIKKE